MSLLFLHAEAWTTLAGRAWARNGKSEGFGLIVFREALIHQPRLRQRMCVRQNIIRAVKDARRTRRPLATLTPLPISGMQR
jgi:hypothetical protein